MLERRGVAPWTGLVYLAANDESALHDAEALISSLARTQRGKKADPKVCQTWHANRFKLGYEKLLVRYNAGILADTFECTPSWDAAAHTYEQVRDALSKFGVVGAHMGVDLTGPYLYFTFALPGSSQALYQEAWASALSACIATGSRTNHHHGIGKLKAGSDGELAQFANGQEWYESAKKIKGLMDPHRVLNPTNLV
jgi:FAD/FMN-containing dehydrogenase